MLGYEFSERAADDLDAIYLWYESQGADLPNRFADELVQALEVARDRPSSCPVFKGRVRTIRCAQFPYRIYFVPLKTRIDVLAVYHTARHPDRWDDPNRE